MTVLRAITTPLRWLGTAVLYLVVGTLLFGWLSGGGEC